jgi:hypothetical protein
VAIIGSPKYGTHGAHGSQRRVLIRHFYTWDNFLSYLRRSFVEFQPFIYGISPYPIGPQTPYFKLGDKTSEPLQNHQFNSSIPILPLTLAVFIVGIRDGLSSTIQNIARIVLHVEYPNMNLSRPPILIDGELAEYKGVPYECTMGIVLHQFIAQSMTLSAASELTPHSFQGGKYDLRPGPKLKTHIRCSFANDEKDHFSHQEFDYDFGLALFDNFKEDDDTTFDVSMQQQVAFKNLN